jgi:DUF4097 and DUF4098 domain-containing protein YvlB
MRLFRFTPSRIATLVAALLVCGTVHDAGAQRRRSTVNNSNRYSSRVDTTFSFDKNGSVSITSISGDIVITGWSRDQVHVRALSEDDNVRLDVSQSRMNLEVSTGRRGGDTRFEVSVPVGVRVMASARSGDISVRGTHGPVEVRAQNGNIDVDDVTSRLDVNTFSGDLVATNVAADVQIGTISGGTRLTDVRGNVEIGTVSGDIDLRGVTAKSVRAKTTSGDVTFDGLIDPAGRYELVTHSGDVRLHIPRDASAQLTVSTWSGGVNSQFPITLRPGEHRIGAATTKRFTFELGGGAARITAETFSGDITITSNGRGASR